MSPMSVREEAYHCYAYYAYRDGPNDEIGGEVEQVD